MSSSIDVPSSRRFALGGIVVVGFTVRLLYLVHVISQPGFAWDDPDSYSANAVRLVESGAWFDFEIVEHWVDGRRYVLPPLYPVFLSLFARFPGYPFTALAGQILLSTLSIVLVGRLGRAVHSETTGLVAASAVALWLPNVIAVWSTMQEALYVPLVLVGFVLLLQAPVGRSALAGVAFGLAALTRSMPVYYVPLAAALLLGQRRFRAALALVLGFLALTLPYSVALSRYLEAPTFIENHGGIRIAQEHGIEVETPPGAIQTAATLLKAFADAPGESARGFLRTGTSILHVNGGRLLQIYLFAETRAGSSLWKLAAHGLADLPLVLSLLLAPFGLVLCRRPSSAAFLGLWVVLNLGLTTLSGFGGPRLRTPFEPHLFVLAAVVAAGSFRPARRAALVAAAAVSLLFASAVVPQIPSSLRARGDYGVHWPLRSVPKRSAIWGKAGFNVLALDGFVEYWVRPRNARPTTVLQSSLGGQPAERVVVDAEHRFRHAWTALELVPVELLVTDEESGAPVRALVVVPGRQAEDR